MFILPNIQRRWKKKLWNFWNLNIFDENSFGINFVPALEPKPKLLVTSIQHPGSLRGWGWCRIIQWPFGNVRFDAQNQIPPHPILSHLCMHVIVVVLNSERQMYWTKLLYQRIFNAVNIGYNKGEISYIYFASTIVIKNKI